MNLKKSLTERYTVKKFDTSKKISTETSAALKDLLRFSPSSVNIQPWHFTIASTKEGKELIAKGTENYAFNTPKILDACEVFVFSTKTTIDSKYLKLLLDQEDQDGRYKEAQNKEDMNDARTFFLSIHSHKLLDEKDWLEKQVYLNVGHFVLGAKMLGLDTVIMEGLDAQVLNEQLNLTEKGYSASVIVAVGYGASDDFNAKLPKSRLEYKDIITQI